MWLCCSGKVEGIETGAVVMIELMVVISNVGFVYVDVVIAYHFNSLYRVFVRYDGSNHLFFSINYYKWIF